MRNFGADALKLLFGMEAVLHVVREVGDWKLGALVVEHGETIGEDLRERAVLKSLNLRLHE